MTEETKVKVNELKAEAFDLIEEEGQLMETMKKAMAKSGTRRQQIAEELKVLESKPKE